MNLVRNSVYQSDDLIQQDLDLVYSCFTIQSDIIDLIFISY